MGLTRRHRIEQEGSLMTKSFVSPSFVCPLVVCWEMYMIRGKKTHLYLSFSTRRRPRPVSDLRAVCKAEKEDLPCPVAMSKLSMVKVVGRQAERVGRNVTLGDRDFTAVSRELQADVPNRVGIPIMRWILGYVVAS